MKNTPSTPCGNPGIGAKRFRRWSLALAIGLLCVVPAQAQLSVEFNIQGAGIGINLRSYPSLVRVPGYPVYYAPRERANFFFYEGLYWVYAEDAWYESRWYNGPWARVDRNQVPLFLLRVPVRYYRQPPAYFRTWRADAPPRWDEHWGNDWAQGRPGWDRWDRRNVPRAAPLPIYQRPYVGDRYPTQPERQEAIRAQHERPHPNNGVKRPLPRPPSRPDAQHMAPPTFQAPRPPTAQPPQHAPQRPPIARPDPGRGQQPAQRDRGDDERGEKGGKKGGEKSGDRGGGRSGGEREPDRR